MVYRIEDLLADLIGPHEAVRDPRAIQLYEKHPLLKLGQSKSFRYNFMFYVGKYCRPDDASILIDPAFDVFESHFSHLSAVVLAAKTVAQEHVYKFNGTVEDRLITMVAVLEDILADPDFGAGMHISNMKYLIKNYEVGPAELDDGKRIRLYSGIASGLVQLVSKYLCNRQFNSLKDVRAVFDLISENREYINKNTVTQTGTIFNWLDINKVPLKNALDLMQELKNCSSHWFTNNYDLGDLTIHSLQLISLQGPMDKSSSSKQIMDRLCNYPNMMSYLTKNYEVGPEMDARDRLLRYSGIAIGLVDLVLKYSVEKGKYTTRAVKTVFRLLSENRENINQGLTTQTDTIFNWIDTNFVPQEDAFYLIEILNTIFDSLWFRNSYGLGDFTIDVLRVIKENKRPEDQYIDEIEEYVGRLEDAGKLEDKRTLGEFVRLMSHKHIAKSDPRLLLKEFCQWRHITFPDFADPVN